MKKIILLKKPQYTNPCSKPPLEPSESTSNTLKRHLELSGSNFSKTKSRTSKILHLKPTKTQRYQILSQPKDKENKQSNNSQIFPKTSKISSKWGFGAQNRSERRLEAPKILKESEGFTSFSSIKNSPSTNNRYSSSNLQNR